MAHSDMAVLVRCLKHLASLPGQRNLDNIFIIRRLSLVSSLDDYSLRFATYMRCSSSAFIVAAALAIRLHRLCPIVVSRWALHKLLAGVVVVAVKWTDDYIVQNSFYAECAGVSLSEMNQLESAVIQLLEFNLFVSHEEYEATAKRFQAERSENTMQLALPAVEIQGKHTNQAESGADDILSDQESDTSGSDSRRPSCDMSDTTSPSASPTLATCPRWAEFLR
eukprot:c32905_g1_i1.p1 GENE.c32905_g1_i1~~c32905_g1_i1.p1  ORF type:complete len:243 (+),score=53.23 c32905_g1_i1:61-729(+)